MKIQKEEVHRRVCSLGRPSCVARKKSVWALHCVHTLFFHTCRQWRHHRPLPFFLFYLTLGEAKNSEWAEGKTCWVVGFFFLHTPQVVGLIADMLKQFSLNIRILRENFFPGEGIFPWELAWVLTPFPKRSFGWEYKPRCSLCTYAFRRTDSKDPDSRCMPATKTHPARTSTTTKCDYLNDWIKKKKNQKNRSHTQKLIQNGEPQKYSWEGRRRRKRIFLYHFILRIVSSKEVTACLLIASESCTLTCCQVCWEPIPFEFCMIQSLLYNIFATVEMTVAVC